MEHLSELQPAMTPFQSSYDRFLEVVHQQPDAVALIALNKGDTTFGELGEQIVTNRRVLATWGVRRGERVGLLISSRDSLIAAYHAVISCATAVPINAAATEDEILFDVRDYKVSKLIVEFSDDGRLLVIAKRAGVDVIVLTSDSQKSGFISLEVGSDRAATDPELPLPDDLMVLLHTSGTTAAPKIIPLTQYSRVAEIEIPAYRRLLTPPGKCFNVMPLHHRQGLIGEGQSVLMTGSAVILAEFVPRRFTKEILDSGADWFALVPSMHQMIVAAEKGRENIFQDSALRFCKSTSATLPSALRRDMLRTYGIPVVEAYAAQECSLIAATEVDMTLNKEGSVGRMARDGISIRDELCNELDTGVTGEVCVEFGPLVINGYEDNPDANAEAFKDGYYTGDGGFIDEEGYLFLTGRVRDVINRGGEKISPVEVDEVLMEHTAIAMAAAFGAPNAQMGQEVMAAVVLNSGEKLSPTEIRAFVSKKLSFAKVPKRVFIVDKLPLNATGKIMRRELATMLVFD